MYKFFKIRRSSKLYKVANYITCNFNFWLIIITLAMVSFFSFSLALLPAFFELFSYSFSYGEFKTVINGTAFFIFLNSILITFLMLQAMAIVEASEDEVNTLKVTDAPGSALNDVEEELINDIAFLADVSPLLLSKVMSESPLVQEMFKIVKDGNHGLFNREDLVSHLVDVTGMSKLEIEQTLDAASKQNELLKIDERNSTKH